MRILVAEKLKRCCMQCIIGAMIFAGIFGANLLNVEAKTMRKQNKAEIQRDTAAGNCKFGDILEYDGELYGCFLQGEQGVYKIDLETGERTLYLAYEKNDATKMLVSFSEQHGYIYVLDGQNRGKILQYTLDGTYIGTVLESGRIPERMMYVNGGYIYYISPYGHLSRNKIENGAEPEHLDEDKMFPVSFSIQENKLYYRYYLEDIDDRLKGRKIFELQGEKSPVLIKEDEMGEQDESIISYSINLYGENESYQKEDGKTYCLNLESLVEQKLNLVNPENAQTGYFVGAEYVYPMTEGNDSSICSYNTETGETKKVINYSEEKTQYISLRDVSGRSRIYYVVAEKTDTYELDYKLHSVNLDGSGDIELGEYDVRSEMLY